MESVLCFTRFSGDGFEGGTRPEACTLFKGRSSWVTQAKRENWDLVGKSSQCWSLTGWKFWGLLWKIEWVWDFFFGQLEECWRLRGRLGAEVEDQLYGEGGGQAQLDAPWDRNSFSAARPALESPLFSPFLSLFLSSLFFSLLQKCLRRLTIVINLGSISIQLLPDGSAGKESACSAGDTRDTGSIPGSGRSPVKGKWQPTPVFLLGKPYGQRNLSGLQSKGLQRIGHDWVTKPTAFRR